MTGEEAYWAGIGPHDFEDEDPQDVRNAESRELARQGRLMKTLRIDGTPVKISDELWVQLERVRKLRGLDNLDEIIIEAIACFIEKEWRRFGL